jgi:hypothetical protein
MMSGLFWIIINTLLSLVLSAMLIHKLVNWRDNFIPLERIGMGLMAGSVLMTIPVIWTHGPTPFDTWTTTVLRLGAVLYFAGRLSRHMRHFRNNATMASQARARQLAKSKDIGP